MGLSNRCFITEADGRHFAWLSNGTVYCADIEQEVFEVQMQHCATIENEDGEDCNDGLEALNWVIDNLTPRGALLRAAWVKDEHYFAVVWECNHDEEAEEPGVDLKVTELTQMVKSLTSRVDRLEAFTSPIGPRSRPDPLSEYGDPLR